MNALNITDDQLTIFGYAAVIHLLVVIILFTIGRRHKNDSILDIYWGFSFVIAVWMAYLLSGADSSRAILVALLVTIWGSRLGYHLLSRWARLHGIGGDLRYQDIKDKLEGQQKHPLKTFFILYIGMWCAYLVPQINIMLVIMSPAQIDLTLTDIIAASIMVLAIMLELIADLQLDAFKADPQNKGKILNTGVWAWSRHPNYFANFCCYWCIFIISLQVPGLFWTIISPLFMTWLLVGFTGKKWMDSHMRKHRPGYEEYINNTSSFLPMPPKRKSPD